MTSSTTTRNHWATLLVGAALLVACGGDDTASSGTAQTVPRSGSEAPGATAPSTTLSTLPPPDGEWARTLIEAYDGYVSTDQDRVLAHLDAVDAEPEREVELFAEYLAEEGAVLDATLAAFPGDDPATPGLAEATTTWTEALERRRDVLLQAADELTADSDRLQAELDGGESADYTEVRAMLGEDDEALPACFAVQELLDQYALGVLRCLPGPDGGEPPVSAEPLPEVDPGPNAADVTIEVTFGDDSAAGEPAGEFRVTGGDEDLGCTAGVWTDVDLSADGSRLTKEFVCGSGGVAGAFTAHQAFDGSDRWVIDDGTDAFADLVGVGSFMFDRTTEIETWSGRVGRP